MEVDKRGYDRLIILTDEQAAEPLSAPLGNGYVINVSCNRNGVGYGPWTHIDGWSESVLSYIHASETVTGGEG